MKIKSLVKVLMLWAGLCAFPLLASGQGTFSGKVLDQNGDPLVGAGVVVKGTSTGFITDVDGNFEMRNVRFPVTVVVSFIGYQDKEIILTGSEGQPLIIALDSDRNILDETVVVGYASMKRRDLVGAVDQVGSEVIGNRPNASLTRSLQGEIAGLNITVHDSKPSHSGSYNVRGTSSIGAGGTSLVLIDGVEGDLSMVNPQDVESVSVLKDASSTAVYGARGAFGVILVTTKNAKKGTPVINYNGSVTANRRTVIYDGITDSNEWLDWWIAAYNGYYNGSKALLNHIDSKAPYSQAIYDEILRRKGTDLPVAEVSYDVPNFGYAYYDNHDWFKEFYREYHWTTEHNVSVSGGNDNADYYVSGRYYDSQGVYKVGDERYKKYNLRAKGSLKIRPWMKLTNNMSFTIDDTYLPTSYNDNSVTRYMQHCVQPMAPLRNPDGSWTPASGVSGYASMYEKSSYMTDNYFILRDKVDLDIDIIKEVLNFKVDYSYNYTGRTRGSVHVPVVYSKEPGVMITTTTSKTISWMEQEKADTRYQAANAYATFSPKLGEKHRLTTLLGYNVEWSNYASTTATRVGFTSDKRSFKLMDGEATITADGNEWAYLGAFYRVNYSFLDRYLVELSGRYDGSSKFPTNSRWGFFPSASIGWRVSEEPFMAWSRSWLDNLKFRLSAGSMGNGNVAPYLYTSEMSVAKATDVVLGGSLPSYTSVASIVPFSLTWETATTYDAGVDFDLLNSRLSGSFDYYIRNTTDMYTAGATLPGVFGGSVPKGNNAELRTNGWEFSIQWRDQFMMGGKPFTYSIKGTLWDSMSTVTKFAGNDGKTFGTIGNLVNNMGQPDYYEGMVIGEMWGYTVLGLFKDQADIDASAKQSYKQSSDKKTRPGHVKFADLDGDGIVDYNGLTLEDHGDLSIIGNSTPRYRFGLNLSGQWNGIGLSVFLQGVGKRDWYPGKDCGYFWGKYSRPFFYFIPTIHAQDNPNVAKMNDDNTYATECLNYDTAYWPRLTTYMTNGDANKTTIMNMPNTRYVQNAAYLRVKSIQLDYSFNQKVCSTLGLSGLKVYVNGENLFTFTPLHKWGPNLDPEGIDGGDTDFVSSGINGNTYPVFKMITCGVNVTF